MHFKANKKKSMSELCDNFKWQKIHVIVRILLNKGRNGQKIFEEIMTNFFQIWIKLYINRHKFNKSQVQMI